VLGVVVRKLVDHSSRRGRGAFQLRCATSLAVCLLASELSAEPLIPGNGFTWQRDTGAESCLPEAELRAKITALFGRDPFVGPSAPTVSATVSRRGEGLAASVRMREWDSLRETARDFQTPGTDCTPLTDAVALALALALSPDAPVEAASPAPSRNPPPIIPDKEALEPPDRCPRPWAALAELVWAVGAVPRPVVGVGVQFRHSFGRRFFLGVGGDWLPPASEGGQFSVELFRARLLACGAPLRGAKFALFGCGSGEGGSLIVANEAATLESAGAHPWFGVGLGARGTAELGAGWVVEAGIGAVIPTSRPIYATPSCPLLGFQQPPAFLTALISAGWQF
jgi:hypothetical protein